METLVKHPRGTELLRQVVNHIIEHPEEWSQGVWHSSCGTYHCVAGHAEILGGRVTDPYSIAADSNSIHKNAANLLGLSPESATWLFSSRRTLFEIYRFTYACLHPDEFVGGYDSNGYNERCRDRTGRDRNGLLTVAVEFAYDLGGYDCWGYNRAGRNIHGDRLPFLEQRYKEKA
jgi:hypothetical protein